MLRGKWWEVYQDPQLNALEEQIVPENQNLRAALQGNAVRILSAARLNLQR